MWQRRWATQLLGVLSLVLLACNGPRSLERSVPGATEAQPPSALKRIALVIKGEPTVINSQLTSSGGGAAPGTGTVEGLLHAGVAELDQEATLRPQLAEAVPSVENGQWKVLADGRMELTWTIREGVQWHDGVRLTPDDLLFSAEVKSDRDLPFAHIAFDSIESVRTTGPRSVIVTWRRPYIEADTMFTSDLALPLPKHILAEAYRGDKANFMQLSYWNQEFVGLGPYRLGPWVPGSHLIVHANPQYALGRPKIDEIEVKFIPDANTIAANLLAGAVDLAAGMIIPFEQALEIASHWPSGRMDTAFARTTVVFPQFIDASPPIVGNVEFRRALFHGIDRQQLADTFGVGRSSVAHAMVGPNEPNAAAILDRVPHYAYDPARATQLIQDLGYRKDAEGGFRDPANQRLSVEIRTTTNVDQRVMFAVADSWQRLGLAMEPVVIPPQRHTDREYRATFPAFVYTGQPLKMADRIRRMHSSQIPLAENRFTGNNTARYRNPDLDAMIDRYLSTIPPGERLELGTDVFKLMMDQVVVMPLYYELHAAMVANRMTNYTFAASNNTWKVHEWDVRN